MPKTKRSGPMEGHWCTTLGLISSADDGNSFICNTCMSSGNSRERSTLRSSASASNLYTHFRQVHPEIYSVLLPIVQSRERNKKRFIQKSSLHDFLENARQRNVDDAMIHLFTRPEVSLSLIEQATFRKLMNCMNPKVRVPTRATLNNWISKKFNEVLNLLQEQILAAEYVALTFDGRSTLRNEAVLGFMILFLDDNLLLQTRTIGTFSETKGQKSEHLAELIGTVVKSRCAKRVPDFFISDSAPVNKAGVRKFMMCEGDEYWFPCNVHFCQLAMKESVQAYFEQDIEMSSDSFDSTICNDMSISELWAKTKSAAESNSPFRRITNICRSIHTAIKRNHSYASLFRESQRKYGLSGELARDVPTRFDSTFLMFRSVHYHSPAIREMQREGVENSEIWPSLFHLTADEFRLIRNVTEILVPIHDVTLALSSSFSWVGDVLPLLTSAVDNVRRMDVVSDAKSLQISLIDSMSSRIKMLLGVEKELPFNGGGKMGNTLPTEYVVAAYLNPRYSCAVHACYGYSERTIISELIAIYSSRCDEKASSEDDVFEITTSNRNNISEAQLADEWASRQINRTPGSSIRCGRRDTIRKEFVAYQNEVGGVTFTARNSREYWKEKRLNGKLPKLGRIARLLLTVPASAVPQECHFSELKRRSSGLRNRSKVSTLDRDSVVCAWLDFQISQ